MSLQPADEKPSRALEQDANVASDDTLQLFQKGDDDKPEIEPSLFSAALAEVSVTSTTTWVFYFDAGNRIIVEWNTPHGGKIIDFLRIDGEVVFGNPAALAATLFNGYPRLYYFNPNCVLHEAFLKENTTDEWGQGSLNKYGWLAYPYSGLTALSENLPTGIFIRIRYHAQVNPSRWTVAEYIGRGDWVRRII